MKNEQFGEISRQQMEAATRLAQLSIDSSQKIMAFQAELSRELFKDCVANANAQASSRNPQEIMVLRTKYAQETAKKVMKGAQQIAEISYGARVELSRSSIVASKNGNVISVRGLRREDISLIERQSQLVNQSTCLS